MSRYTRRLEEEIENLRRENRKLSSLLYGPESSIRMYLVSLGVKPEHVNDFWRGSGISGYLANDVVGAQLLYKRWKKARKK